MTLGQEQYGPCFFEGVAGLRPAMLSPKKKKRTICFLPQRRSRHSGRPMVMDLGGRGGGGWGQEGGSVPKSQILKCPKPGSLPFGVVDCRSPRQAPASPPCTQPSNKLSQKSVVSCSLFTLSLARRPWQLGFKSGRSASPPCGATNANSVGRSLCARSSHAPSGAKGAFNALPHIPTSAILFGVQAQLHWVSGVSRLLEQAWGDAAVARFVSSGGSLSFCEKCVPVQC